MTLAETAGDFSSDIKIDKEGQVVDGKSIMQLMMLAATQGTQLTILAEGDDAEAAVAKLCALIESKFDEE